MPSLESEEDIEQLRKVALFQQKQLELLTRVLAEKSATIDDLTGRSGDLQATLELLNAKNVAASEEPFRKAKPKRGSPKSRKPAKLAELKRELRLFELDEADRSCPACGGALEPMAGQAETSEMVDVVEVQYRLVEVQRQKYVCRCGGCVETAPGPLRAVEGGRYSLEFAAKVASDKYLDHLPLHRQSRIMMRQGLDASPNTLWDQLWSLRRRLVPAFEALHHRLLAEPVIGLDQTAWPNLDAKGKKPWQMWCFTANGMITYQICRDKSAETMKKLLGSQPRIIVCDMLSTHGKAARDGPHLTLAACWAHAFRRFRDAAADHLEAESVMELIGRLYEIDNGAQTLEEKGELRATQSRQVCAELHARLLELAFPKVTSIGEASRYVLRFWDCFTRFLEDPRIHLDNNETERGIRGPVVGRKNHYGSKSKGGTEVAAIYYSLFETAKLQGVDPTRYILETARAACMDEVLLPGSLQSVRESAMRARPN